MTGDLLVGVTGATGHIGRAVADHLADDGVPARLIVRDPSRAPSGYTDVTVSAFTHDDAAVAALRGVDVLFMVSAAENEHRLDQHRAFVDAAASAGVDIVYTSFLGAAEDATVTLARDHWATEEHIRASGMAWTFLRDSFYLDVFPLFAGEDGVIRGPAGEGAVGAVAREDVAWCAAAVLMAPRAHTGRSYDLTGPEALTLYEMAETITRVTGRPTSYLDETLEEAYASRAPYGAPPWQVDAWVSTYTAIASGELDVVTGDVRLLTGRDPVGLAELLAKGQDRV